MSPPDEEKKYQPEVDRRRQEEAKNKRQKEEVERVRRQQYEEERLAEQKEHEEYRRQQLQEYEERRRKEQENEELRRQQRQEEDQRQKIAAEEGARRKGSRPGDYVYVGGASLPTPRALERASASLRTRYVAGWIDLTVGAVLITVFSVLLQKAVVASYRPPEFPWQSVAPMIGLSAGFIIMGAVAAIAGVVFLATASFKSRGTPGLLAAAPVETPTLTNPALPARVGEPARATVAAVATDVADAASPAAAPATGGDTPETRRCPHCQSAVLPGETSCGWCRKPL